MDNKNLNQNENQNADQQENLNQDLDQNVNQEPVQPPVEKQEEFVIVIKNKETGLETLYPLEEGKEVIVGANPESSVCVEDPYISSQHFSLKLIDGKVEVEDLQSTNGTYLLLNKLVTILPERVLLAGKTTFKLEKRMSNES